MKKSFFAFGAIILVCVLMLSLVACGESKSPSGNSDNSDMVLLDGPAAAEALASSFSTNTVLGDDVNIAVKISLSTSVVSLRSSSEMSKSLDSVILYEENSDENGKTVFIVDSSILYDYKKNFAHKSENEITFFGKIDDTYHKFYAHEEYDNGVFDSDTSSYTDTTIENADIDSAIAGSKNLESIGFLKSVMDELVLSFSDSKYYNRFRGRVVDGTTIITASLLFPHYNSNYIIDCYFTAYIEDGILTSCNITTPVSSATDTKPYCINYEYDVEIDYDSTLTMPSSIEDIKNKHNQVGKIVNTDEFIKLIIVESNKSAKEDAKKIADIFSEFVSYYGVSFDFTTLSNEDRAGLIHYLAFESGMKIFDTKAGNEDNLLAGADGFLLIFTSQGISVTCIMYGDTTKQLGYIVSNEGTVTDISDEIPE